MNLFILTSKIKNVNIIKLFKNNKLKCFLLFSGSIIINKKNIDSNNVIYCSNKYLLIIFIILQLNKDKVIPNIRHK